MQSFRTTFEIQEHNPKLNYNSKSLFIGSCFTENIGNHFKELKFPVCINPTGIIYNPLSICKTINLLNNGYQFKESDLDFFNELWFSFCHHGRFAHPDKMRCLENINSELSNASSFFKQTEFLFITFGSAYAYTYKKRNEVVANCHKLPAEYFNKSLLPAETIIHEFEKALTQIQKSNPNLQIIFTVSPVRHWTDGAIENQRSKSILITAIHEIIQRQKNCFYFPAYELMMDDLRDYRFYAEDMIHPNSTAIEYIREKFTSTFIDEASIEIMKKVMKLKRAMEHRPFGKVSQSYNRFRKDQMNFILELKKEFPFLDLQEFEEFFK
jgi:hypothetical protein